ncbi:MAG TPA: NAD(P)/FAD-dependent oxidoreductase [Bacteroidota bacterium]|nr:NAD(P)/FAD-dependent oxidoreductase [Bacteroidota bacterium]
MKSGKAQKTIVIIGGGAAGMIAAWRAGVAGATVILLEKNSKLGLKLLISGGGKCNITHAGNMKEMGACFRIHESRFLKYSFHEFTNGQLLGQLEHLGVETYVREDGRIFPRSGKAGDVVHALRRLMERSGVEIRLSNPVEEIILEGKEVCAVRTAGELIPTAQVVVATGGLSFPKTGTTGDGFRWLRELGHHIVPPRPALAPVHLSPPPPAEWQGVALRDCAVSCEAEGKKRAGARGDLLLTHRGISGPAALEVSKEAFIAFEQHSSIDIVVDLKPERSHEELDKDIQMEISSNGTRNLDTLIDQFAPRRLVSFILASAKIDGRIKCHQVKREDRRKIIETIKHWKLGTVKEIPLDGGEVTAGGVDLQEVDPKTMRSRIVKGLYVCGEVLDIAGPIGGYNLQAAFSTGYVAGESAGKEAANGGGLE